MIGITPGPWEVCEVLPVLVNVAAENNLHPHEAKSESDCEEWEAELCHDDWRVCDCSGDMFSRPYEECLANAAAISKVPEMLAFIQAVAKGDGAFSPGENAKRASILLESIKVVDFA